MAQDTAKAQALHERLLNGLKDVEQVFLNGHAISEPGPRGEVVTDDDFLLLVNAHSEPVTFRLPGARFAARWHVVISSAAPPTEAEEGEGAAVERRGAGANRLGHGPRRPGDRPRSPVTAGRASRGPRLPPPPATP